MKTVGFFIAVLLILGGMKAILSPSDFILSYGGHRYNPQMRFTRLAPSTVRLLGAASVVLGSAVGLATALAKSASRWEFAPGTTTRRRLLRHRARRRFGGDDAGPIEVFVEVDDRGKEYRKVELFRGGVVGFACEKSNANGTHLDDAATIGLASECSTWRWRKIRESEFEEQWARAIQR